MVQRIGRIQSFGGTCPACCGDLYLSSYTGGWFLRCVYCQLALREGQDRVNAGGAFRRATAIWNEDA